MQRHPCCPVHPVVQSCRWPAGIARNPVHRAVSARGTRTQIARTARMDGRRLHRALSGRAGIAYQRVAAGRAVGGKFRGVLPHECGLGRDAPADRRHARRRCAGDQPFVDHGLHSRRGSGAGAQQDRCRNPLAQRGRVRAPGTTRRWQHCVDGDQGGPGTGCGGTHHRVVRCRNRRHGAQAGRGMPAR